MTLVPTPRNFTYPQFFNRLAGQPAFGNSNSIDATGEYLAVGMMAEDDMTINNVVIRWGSAIGASAIAEIRIETMVGGLSSGVLWAANTKKNTGLTIANSTTVMYTLDAPAVILRGSYYVVKILWVSGGAIQYSYINNLNAVFGVPFIETNTSGSAAKAIHVPVVLALGNNPTSFYKLTNMYPVSATTVLTVNNANSGAYGVRFKFQGPFRLEGVRMWFSSAASGNFNLALYDDAGIAIGTPTPVIGINQFVSSSGITQYMLNAAPDLLANTWYNMMFEPTTTTNVVTMVNTIASTDYHSAMFDGLFHYVTRISGVWDKTRLTEFPLMDLVLGAVDNGAGSGATVLGGKRPTALMGGLV